jgi:hypothetical protein
MAATAAAGDEPAWTEELLDAASVSLAKQAADAAGLSLEDWLERAIRRSTAGPGETTRLPSAFDHGKGVVIDQPRAPRRRGRALVLIALPTVVLAAFGYLAMSRSDRGPASLALAPQRAPEIALALPPAPRAAPAEPSDPAALARWLEPAAGRGDALAQYRLGTLYALGKGVAKDYARAAPLLRAAAESGLAEAQFDYAVLCAGGLGVEQDLPQAIGWYRKAAAQGNANAEVRLGYAYAKGIGIGRDMKEAAEWFRRGAEAGVVDAQYNLGFLYEHGEGAARSPVDAYAWYSLAGAHGDTVAQQAADRIGRDFSAQQFKDALQRMSELQQAIARQR